MTTSLKFFAPARISDIPPISIFSIISCSVPPLATVCSKRIKVDYDKVDSRDIILLHLLLVVSIVTACKNATEYFRMESLHAATENTRVCGHVLNLFAVVAQRFDKLLCTPSAKEFNTLPCSDVRGYPPVHPYDRQI